MGVVQLLRLKKLQDENNKLKPLVADRSPDEARKYLTPD
jgi:hypothetical protein